VRPRATDRL